MAENRDPGWYIATDLFDNGGTIYNDWGPFPSQDLAIRVCVLVEATPRNRSLNRTFAVDEIRSQVTADV